MSVHVLSWVMRHSETTGTDRLVLFCLADRADADGLCWPSIPTIARDARVHEDTARRAVRRLVDDGHVELVDATAGGRGRSNRYRVLTETPAPREGLPERETPADASETPADASVNPRGDAGGTVREPSEEEPADVSSALASPKVIAREVATRYYDWHAETYNVAPPEPYMAIAKIVEAALRAGHTRGAIGRGLRALDADGRPLTRQTLWTAAARPTRSERHDEVDAVQRLNAEGNSAEAAYRETGR